MVVSLKCVCSGGGLGVVEGQYYLFFSYFHLYTACGLRHNLEEPEDQEQETVNEDHDNQQILSEDVIRDIINFVENLKKFDRGIK